MSYSVLFCLLKYFTLGLYQKVCIILSYYVLFMPDEFKKVSARIPLPLIEKLEDMGISNQTEAIIKGLERLISEDSEKSGRDTENTRENNNKTAVLQARIDELQAHNETLKKELEDIKAMHNNYFLQVQTLINQKAIEAPGNKKKWYKFW